MEFIACIGLSKPGVVGSGAVTQVYAVCGNGYDNIYLLLIHCGRITLIILPLGIQGDSVHGCIQLGHLCAAFRGGKPALEGIAVVCGNRANRRLYCRIISLNTAVGFTAIGINMYKAVMSGRCLVVYAVNIHIRFAETATHQIVFERTAGLAPTPQPVDQLITGSAVFNGLMDILIGIICPPGSHVVRKQHQRIKLILGQLQTVSFDDPLV